MVYKMLKWVDYCCICLSAECELPCFVCNDAIGRSRR